MGISLMKYLVKEGEDWENLTDGEFEHKRNWLSNNIYRNLETIGRIDLTSSLQILNFYFS